MGGRKRKLSKLLRTKSVDVLKLFILFKKQRYRVQEETDERVIESKISSIYRATPQVVAMTWTRPDRNQQLRDSIWVS